MGRIIYWKEGWFVLFTGIIEEVGTVKKIIRGTHSAVLHIAASTVLQGTKPGDSIAVNGICLTVTKLSNELFSADIMHETLDRSSLGSLFVGSKVNLERAMPANGRFGGHIVAGHADGTAQIQEIRRDDNAVWFTLQTKPELMRYIAEKGSVTLDGISLTVAKAGREQFSVSTIPHTVAQTNLHSRKKGDTVNLETDVMAKYIERLLTAVPQPKQEGITHEFLLQSGF